MNGWVFIIGQILFICLQLIPKNNSNEENAIFLVGNILCCITAISIFVEKIVGN